MIDQDRLHSIFTNAGVSDDELMGGLHLTQKGYDKLAQSFGASVDEVKAAIDSLVASLRNDLQESFIYETEDEDTYDTELKAKGGSYNFPWKLNGKTGTGSAAYGNKSVTLIDIRDSEGTELPELLDNELILAQAINFIDKV